MSSRRIPKETEVLVIGAGSGGYVAAIRAGQLNLDVTLVEKDAHGGTCLNHGCIPSKALITASSVAHDAANAEEIGVRANPSVDMATMVDWKDGVVDQLTGGVEKLCKANQVSLVDAVARFEDDHRARLKTDNGNHEIRFENAIIATGSRPIQLPGFSFAADSVLSSRDALALEDVPDSLVVIGAGYIGMELATVFAKLGTDVTVVEMLNDVLPGFDADLSRPVKQRAEDLRIEFNFGEAAKKWENAGGGIEVVTETENGEASVYSTEKVLVAVGREPVTDTLNLDAVGLEPTDRGFLDTDNRACTTLDHVFAAGDVAGEPMLAHKGSMEGQVAAEVTAGKSSRLDRRAMPAAVFTGPEIGTVGLTEVEANNTGSEPVVGEFPFRASGRALTVGQTEGFLRIVADADTDSVRWASRRPRSIRTDCRNRISRRNPGDAFGHRGHCPRPSDALGSSYGGS